MQGICHTGDKAEHRDDHDAFRDGRFAEAFALKDRYVFSLRGLRKESQLLSKRENRGQS